MDQREDQTEKNIIIRRLALNPMAHKKLWAEYPEGIKSDATAAHFLLFDGGFSKIAADALIAEYKETASFAALYEPSIKADKLDKKDDKGADNPLPPKLNIGDRVQVTLAGTDMFADGAIIRGFSDDGAWVFTDKSSSGAKVEEITLLEAATEHTPERPTMPAHLLKKPEDALKGNRKAVFPISDGDVTLTFPEGISDAGLKRLKRYLDIFLDEQIEGAQKPG